MAAYPLNQYAPEAYAGVNTPPPDVVGYEDKTYEYVYSPPTGALTANQLINPDSLAIQNDADFYLRGWYISLATGNFQIMLTDSTGYQLQSGMINSAALSQAASDPTLFSPEHPFPAGGKIQITIQDLSGAPNSIQIVFKGVKRFRISKPLAQ